MNSSETFKPVDSEMEYDSSYSIPELYAETSSAVLYRVRKAGKYFIIKTPKDNSGKSLAMLQREYELSIGLQHPNVVNVFTYEPSTVVGPGIVMEYVDGRTLEQFLAENPTLAMRVRVFEQLLQAVAYIHRSGLVHNDIKPENILITRSDNDVKLIDFGLSDSDAYYLARMLGCTKAYASPELLAREKEIDARSDIYSLGVVMKEIFGNRFSGISSRCLRKEKSKRFANAEELLSAFKHRGRPLKVIMALLMAILVLLPLLGYVTMVLEEREYLSTRDAMIAQVEKDVEAIYRTTADSVSRAVYREFAINNLVSFYEVLGNYQKENILPISDPELNSMLSSCYMRKHAACLEMLTKKIESIPSFYSSDLTPQEIVYYDSLVSHRLPYVPYE
ncbi:MAG: serine/threonine protein kinase [Bacteroidaceae bacterium]|nr:serine/threonine protein kinase [Bacteroidaceae bacterium]